MCIVHWKGGREPEVLACAQAGCRDCLDAVIEQNEGLIHAVLQRTHRCGVSYDDLLQEGRIAVWRAVCGFDRGRGYAFSTYAWVAIERRIQHTVARATRPQGYLKRGEPTELLDAVLQEVWRDQVGHTLEQALIHLPPGLRQVIVVVYGLNGEEGCSMAALGRQRGLSRERIRQLRNDGLVLLRLPAVAGALHQVCGRNTRKDQARLLAMNRAWLRRRRARS